MASNILQQWQAAEHRNWQHATCIERELILTEVVKRENLTQPNKIEVSTGGHNRLKRQMYIHKYINVFFKRGHNPSMQAHNWDHPIKNK